MSWSKEVDFFIVISGIFGFYLYFGYIQESLYIIKDTDGNKFDYPEVIVLFQCFFGYLISQICNLYKVIWFTNQPIQQKKPILHIQIIHSISFISAMSLTNYALQYVSYPTQALAKSCKILPVLVGNLLGMKAPLSKARYFSALLVTLGILLFNFAKTKESGSDSVTGLLLLGLALVMDGVNSFCTVIFKQERAREEFKPTGPQMMLYCNKFGFLLSLFVIGVKSSTQINALNLFVRFNPTDLLFRLSAIGVASALGQVFIFRAATLFGSLTLTIITTTRKFLTTMLSIIAFNHPVSMQQFAALILVVLGVSLDYYSQFIVKAKKD